MIEKISEEWLIRGFSCDLWVDPPGQCWEDYKHKTDELFMVLEGKIELELAGKVMQPELNELVFIPAHTLHSVRNIGKTEARWLYGYRLRSGNESDISLFNE